MQTPSQTVPLDLHFDSSHPEADTPGPGESLQKIIRFDLKEEGNHVLAVSISYTETLQGTEGAPTGGRSRTFRKLYQFIAAPYLSVRTKATELPSTEVEDKSHGPYGRTKLLRYVLEAQLENVAEDPLLLVHSKLEARPPFKATSINWDAKANSQSTTSGPTINPRDVQQVAFLVEQQKGISDGLETLQADMKRDGRVTLGQLSLEWRSTMGDKGVLSTGNLLTRRRES